MTHGTGGGPGLPQTPDGCGGRGKGGPQTVERGAACQKSVKPGTTKVLINSASSISEEGEKTLFLTF